MKHLKIAFAIVFFSLLGGINSELMAQFANPYKLDCGVKFTKTMVSMNKQYELHCDLSSFKLVKMDGDSETEVWVYTFPGEADKVYIDQGTIMAKINGSNVVLFGNEKRAGKGTFLELQNDGNLVLYGGSGWSFIAGNIKGNELWATGTCDGVLGGCGKVGDR